MKNYFPHDHYARSDKKLINLTRVLGLGAGWLYWCIIEMLYEENGWLKTSDLESIAYDLRTDTQTITRIVSEFDLFFTEGDRFSSKAVHSRLKLIEAKSSAASKAARQRWQKCKEDANALQTHSDRNALNEIKTNESKLNENKTVFRASLSTPQKESSQMGLGFVQSDNDTDGTPLLERTDLTAKKEKPKEKSSAKKEKVTIDFGDFDTPEFRDKWQEFLDHRRKIKKPVTTIASEQRLFNPLTAYDIGFAIKLIEETVDSGKWLKMVYDNTPEKYKQYQGKTTTQNQNYNGSAINTYQSKQQSGNNPSGAELAYLIAS